MDQPLIRPDEFESVFADFEVYADPAQTTECPIAILVKPLNTKPYMLPLTLDAARNLNTTLMQTIIAVSELK